MSAYYNENDAFAAAWLRELIARNLIAPGEVDERSIEDVQADDLKGFKQCHFFAGIGGWSYALRLARWPDDEPVWSGSCPCQPLSSAGQRRGHTDERHLWPAFYGLIAECQPATVFGEQVASALGREWLSAVRADLESLGYALGAADLPAAGVGAPHIRQRLFWVAHADGGQSRQAGSVQLGGQHRQQPQDSELTRGLGHTRCEGRAQVGSLSIRRGEGSRAPRLGQRLAHQRPCGDGLGDAFGSGLEVIDRQPGDDGQELAAFERAGPEPWAAPEWLQCRDGKARPTQPGLFPLAHGVPARVGRLRGYGNAILPQEGSEFIAAFCEVVST